MRVGLAGPALPFDVSREPSQWHPMAVSEAKVKIISPKLAEAPEEIKEGRTAITQDSTGRAPGPNRGLPCAGRLHLHLHCAHMSSGHRCLRPPNVLTAHSAGRRLEQKPCEL
jgi:hypothetical protein